jgi:hypothetical protein
MKRGDSIPIANIRLDGGTQPRAVLDFEAIEDYAEAMGAGMKFPPVVVFYDGENYWLADGFHRVKAAYAAGFDSVGGLASGARARRRGRNRRGALQGLRHRSRLGGRRRAPAA